MCPSRLDPYRSKRDPNKTPEPMGSAPPRRSNGAPTFVIQEHHARSLHWDFRLERDGVLVSWALPKGLPGRTQAPTTWPSTSRTTPSSTARFEGDIPKGEYGAGQVTIWDHGTYDTREVARSTR